MKKLHKIILATVVAFAASSGSLTAMAENLGTIMPLGDSITAGYPDGGYRAPLFENLTDAGYQFEFVGSQTDYYSDAMAAAGQTHHEGHSGYRIVGDGTTSGLSENLNDWIGNGTNAVSPDVILLMAGTNEMGDANAGVTGPQHLNSLINDIFGYLPDVELYVASLTWRTTIDPDVREAVKANVATFNVAVPGIVSSYQALGKNIHYVDMYPILTEDDLADQVHPNAIGYEKLGDAWFNAIEAPEPSAAVLLIMGAIAGICFGRNRSKRNN